MTNDSDERGMEIFSSCRERVVGPLKVNSKILKSEEGTIDRLIHRFSINNKYYSRKLESNQRPENVDREMGEFFDRRQAVLEGIKNKTNQNIIKNPIYSHVGKRLL